MENENGNHEQKDENPQPLVGVMVPLNHTQLQLLQALVMLGCWGGSPSEIVCRFMDEKLQDLSRNSRELILSGLNAAEAKRKSEQRITVVKH